MRKIFSSFLIVAMLASVLICGCSHEARAASNDAHHSDGEHHQHGDGAQSNKDCTPMVMQFSQYVESGRPDLKSVVSFSAANIQPVWLPALASNQGIRAPPRDWPDAAHISPPIILCTQRFLI